MQKQKTKASVRIRIIRIALTLLTAHCLLLTVGGCAVVRVATPQWTVTGASLFKQIEIPKISKGVDGQVVVEGYKSGVEAQALGEAIGAGIRAGLGAK